MMVSIIIDNYNYGRFLRQAIESALAQTYPALEIVVVDDGSTDDSRAIISRYHPRIRSIFKANGGQASALNAGFRISHGRIILFLDSDDTLAPHAVARLVPCFEDPSLVKVHWPLRIVNAAGQATGRLMPAGPLPHGLFRDQVLQGGPTSCPSAPTSGNAWARHFLEQVLPIPEDVDYYRSCSDEYLYTLAPVFGPIQALPEPLGTYRIHGANLYAGRPFEEQLQLELRGHAQQCAALSRTLAAHGFHPDLQAWQRHSWFHRLQQARQEILNVVPARSTLILVDDGTWGGPDLFPDRPTLPFLERDGAHWGPPPDDQTAIAELERLRQQGARAIAFAWPAFWWLQHYPAFAHHLKRQYSATLQTERVLLFDLQPACQPNLQPAPAPAPQPAAATHAVTLAPAPHPLVSIVVNNFNYAAFLPDAIESALRQTYPYREVIVVDDGSTDHSRQVIETYGTRIIPCFQPNGGQGAAYNRGFQLSRGQILCYLDADDTLAPTALAEFVTLFDRPEVVKVQWPLRMVRENGTATGQVVPTQPPPAGDLRSRVRRDGPLYDWHLTPPGSGNAYSRPFLQKVFPMPEPPYRNGADVYLVTLAPVYGLIRTAPQPLGTYRAHRANNYLGRPLDEDRLRNYLARFETNASVLQEHLQKQGTPGDPARWKQSNFNYLWPTRLLQAKQDLCHHLPQGAHYILVNDDEWGPGQPVPDRRAWPFLERNGEYWGPPPDDATAIAELERMRNTGAGFIVFWWTAFWWLDHYPRFARHLQSAFPCRLQGEHLLIFDLQPRPARPPQPPLDPVAKPTVQTS